MVKFPNFGNIGQKKAKWFQHIQNKSLEVRRDSLLHEKDLYPAVEKFLKTQKNCLSEYVGSELSLKRGKTNLRADVFGVSNQDEQIIYLCEGKKGLKRRSFGKVAGEAVELLKYADYVF